MKVIVAGELPLLEEVGGLCVDAGHDTTLYLVEDFFSALDSGRLMDEGAGVEVAIELQNESPETKEALVRGLARTLPRQTLVLTSAFATRATGAAAWMTAPERVVGFGLVPPVAGEGLVEVAPAMQTAPENVERAQVFWRGMGQEPVVVRDGPGLVRARVICCLINEAASALLEGVASAEDIDRAMRLGTNYPYGPLQWADIMGLDMVLGVMQGLFREWGEDRYRPSPLLRRMVLAGRLGKKSGEGFYRYSAGEGSD
jgi:3-hydroxybutyryl-CoA dehydrogenase